MSARLSLALDAGGLALSATGSIAVLHPRAGIDLSSLPRDGVRILQPFKPEHDHFQRLGYDCAAVDDAACDAALICLPRAKALARHLVAQASARTRGTIIIDGTKTDGIDSMLKACRARVDVHGSLSKAHGKIFWFSADAGAFADWLAPADQQVDGFAVAPGVFSADGIDPASQLLADTLPRGLGPHVIDLGAGWGFLTAHLLRNPAIEAVDLVEADYLALECARRNLPQERARFHWADATTWAPETRADAVICNPPFHSGRAADTGLGRAFIAAAAGMLVPGGDLWLVANRHLPYETCVDEHFAHFDEVAGTTRFKVLHASRPRRARPTPNRTRR